MQGQLEEKDCDMVLPIVGVEVCLVAWIWSTRCVVCVCLQKLCIFLMGKVTSVLWFFV